MPKLDKLFWVCALLPVVLDRITKYFVMFGVWQSQTITSFFNLYLTHNPGIAWGMGSDLQRVGCFSWLNLLVVCVLVYFIWYMRGIAHDRNMLNSCMLIVSGGISNLIDRVWLGSVIDFIQLHYAGWYFPVFNVADISITLGAIFLTYFVLVDNRS